MDTRAGLPESARSGLRYGRASTSPLGAIGSIVPIRMSHHLMKRAQILFMQPLLGATRRPPNVAGHAARQAFAVAIYSCQRLLTLMAGSDVAIVCHCDVRAR